VRDLVIGFGIGVVMLIVSCTTLCYVYKKMSLPNQSIGKM
jgi:hypothetical protein